MSHNSLVDIRECMLCFCNSQQPDSICIKSSCWQPGKGVVGCGEYLWTSSNGCSSTTELSPMARGWEFPRGFYEHASFVGNKNNRIKERIPGCSLQVRFWFVRQARSCHDWKCDALELEVGWKSTSRPLGLLVPGLFWAPELVPRPLSVLELVPRPLSSPGTGSKASL